MFWARRALLVAALSGAIMIVGFVGVAWAAPPSNDVFSGATVIPAVPFNTTEDTTQATFDAADAAVEQACGVSGLPLSNSVWFAYTPAADQTLQLDTSGSSYQVADAVVTGTPAGFSSVSCGFGGTFNVSQGTTYYIDSLQYGGGSGGTLSLSLTPITPPTAVVTVDSSGTFASKFSGATIVSGTASCSSGAFAYLFGSLYQTVGQTAISGSGSPANGVVCDGMPHPWSFVVTPPSGVFKPGHAIASISMFACSFTCVSPQVTQRIHMTH